jgi:hypothetical protein
MSHGPPPAPAQAKGSWLGLVALLVGLFGCVVWALPINLDWERPFITLPFGLAGLVFAVLGLAGNRRGKPMAALGAIFSLLAILLGVLMIGQLT